MKLKTSKVLILAYLCISSVNCKSATLQQVLSAYCIPTNESQCIGDERATFTGGNISSSVALTTNYCQCDVEDYYYNTSDRSCKLCAYGTYNRDNKATACTNVCSVGSMWELVDDCPVGYFKSETF